MADIRQRCWKPHESKLHEHYPIDPENPPKGVKLSLAVLETVNPNPVDKK
jgi:hypothetical protein